MAARSEHDAVLRPAARVDTPRRQRSVRSRTLSRVRAAYDACPLSSREATLRTAGGNGGLHPARRERLSHSLFAGSARIHTGGAAGHARVTLLCRSHSAAATLEV